MVVDGARAGAGGLAADIAAVLSERGLGGDAIDLDSRLLAFRRDRSRRAEDARRAAAGWARLAGGAPRSDTPALVAGAAAGAGLSRPHRQGARPARRLPAGQWPRRPARAGQPAGPRALPGGGRDRRRRRRAAHPDCRRARPRRHRGALCRPHREPHRTDLRLHRRGTARPKSPPARRADLGRGAAAGAGGRGRRPRAGRGHRASSASPACPGPRRFSSGATASPSCAGRRASPGPTSPTRRWPPPPPTGWRRTSSAKAPLADIAADTLDGALHALVPWDLGRRLDAEAPTHFTAPTGSRLAVDYAAEAGPTVSVRVQELFGLVDPPGAGRRPGALGAGAVVARPPPDPGHARPARLLDGLVGRRAQRDARPLPETSLAGGPGGRNSPPPAPSREGRKVKVKRRLPSGNTYVATVFSSPRNRLFGLTFHNQKSNTN